MNQIVVAVDFSKSSTHALEFAISIANKMKASILMVWVDKLESREAGLSRESRENKIEVKSRFENLINHYKERFTGEKLEYKLRKGKIYNEITTQARNNNADLIIAGAHGISGFEEYWIGSNSYKIVSFASCPVITIRSDFTFQDNINKIVLPIDNTSDSLQKVSNAIELAHYFKSEIHLIGLYSVSIKTLQRKIDKKIELIQKELKEKGVKCKTNFFSTVNITNSIINYAEENKADLIIIMTEQKRASSDILLGPCAQRIVNYSPIPIMSVHIK